jgi:hypothetical protein
MALKKYVNVDHAIIAIFFKKEVNSVVKGVLKRQPKN